MFASRTNWPLTPNLLRQAVEERHQKNLPIIDLTESNPTRCAFSYHSSEILAALASPEVLAYEPQPKGRQNARQAVVEYYADRGVEVDPENIFLTTGTSEAYSYIFRLLAEPGDTVLAPRPSYPLLDFLADLNDVKLAPYSLRYEHGWETNRESVAAAVASTVSPVRAVLVVHPNNPTGSFVHDAELEFLRDTCRRHQLALIADEVFADYSLLLPAASEAHTRVVSHAATRDVLTFTLSGLSKICALPQMKLAWIVVSGPDSLRASAVERLEIIADTYLSVSAPLGHALPRLLATRRSIQPQIRQRLRDNLARLDEALAGTSGLSRLAAEGGWHAILSRAGSGNTKSDEDWAVELVNRDGVLVHPGHFYNFAAEGYFVLSLLPQPEAFAEGVRKLVARLSSRNPATRMSCPSTR